MPVPGDQTLLWWRWAGGEGTAANVALVVVGGSNLNCRLVPSPVQLLVYEALSLTEGQRAKEPSQPHPGLLHLTVPGRSCPLSAVRFEPLAAGCWLLAACRVGDGQMSAVDDKGSPAGNGVSGAGGLETSSAGEPVTPGFVASTIVPGLRRLNILPRSNEAREHVARATVTRLHILILGPQAHVEGSTPEVALTRFLSAAHLLGEAAVVLLGPDVQTNQHGRSASRDGLVITCFSGLLHEVEPRTLLAATAGTGFHAVFALNAGVHGYATWVDSIRVLLAGEHAFASAPPVVFTSYNPEEAEDDVDVLGEHASELPAFSMLWGPEANPNVTADQHARAPVVGGRRLVDNGMWWSFRGATETAL